MRRVAIAATLLVLLACARREAATADSASPSARATDTAAPPSGTAASTAMITLSSSAFANGAPIPAAHSCDGANRSPALAWPNTPKNAASLALLVEDPDAPRGTFIHWVLYDLPPTQTSLPEGVPKDSELGQLGGARQGKTGFGSIGYGGPCPPPGPPHHYHFRLIALDKKLGLPAGATYEQVTAAMRGHEVGTGELVGLYSRAAR